MNNMSDKSKLDSKVETCDTPYSMRACRRYDVVVLITTAQRHPTKPGLRLCIDLNSAQSVSDVCDGENLWQ